MDIRLVEVWSQDVSVKTYESKMGLKKSMSSEFTTEEEASEKEATVLKGFICKLKKT